MQFPIRKPTAVNHGYMKPGTWNYQAYSDTQ